MSKSTRFEKTRPRVGCSKARIVWSIDCVLFFAVRLALPQWNHKSKQFFRSRRRPIHGRSRPAASSREEVARRNHAYSRCERTNHFEQETDGLRFGQHHVSSAAGHWISR